MTDQVKTPTPLEAAVSAYLQRRYPAVTLGRDATTYAIVPVEDIRGMQDAFNAAPATPRAYISIEPGIKSGEPCIGGTRLTAEWVAGHIWDGWTQDDILTDWDYLTRADLMVACWYVSQYGPRVWRRRWSTWAVEAFHCLWESAKQADCPWPPTKHGVPS